MFLFIMFFIVLSYFYHYIVFIVVFYFYYYYHYCLYFYYYFYYYYFFVYFLFYVFLFQAQKGSPGRRPSNGKPAARRTAGPGLLAFLPFFPMSRVWPARPSLACSFSPSSCRLLLPCLARATTAPDNSICCSFSSSCVDWLSHMGPRLAGHHLFSCASQAHHHAALVCFCLGPAWSASWFAFALPRERKLCFPKQSSRLIFPCIDHALQTWTTPPSCQISLHTLPPTWSVG